MDTIYIITILLQILFSVIAIYHIKNDNLCWKFIAISFGIRVIGDQFFDESKIEVNKRIDPIITITIERGIPDTTFVYTKPN